ncbi:inositol monophosphatase family protein [Comamonadaceae bacterium G21597-S1]|nr:inositol monophosphatase family protein [Comamonadaceae bacterium G21597-S1]
MTELMTAITEIVRAGGATMRQAFTAPHKPAYSMKGRQDYLTATDGAVEQLVRDAIERHFPGDAVLGEEGGGSVDGTRLWIVDPVDGTANFARQIPHYCISLGLLVDGRLEAGAIYEPNQDELFLAQRGKGAWLNGERMQVSGVSDINQSTVEIGWSPRIPVQTYVDMVGRAAHAGCSVRRAGSGALGLAYVAAGRIEAYAEAHINSWDVAGSLLLITEAGGHVSDFWAPGGIANGNPILASNAALKSSMQELFGTPLT